MSSMSVCASACECVCACVCARARTRVNKRVAGVTVGQADGQMVKLFLLWHWGQMEGSGSIALSLFLLESPTDPLAREPASCMMGLCANVLFLGVCDYLSTLFLIFFPFFVWARKQLISCSIRFTTFLIPGKPCWVNLVGTSCLDMFEASCLPRCQGAMLHSLHTLLRSLQCHTCQSYAWVIISVAIAIIVL